MNAMKYVVAGNAAADCITFADGTCTGANGILANGGYIVDATLRVKGATGIEQVKSEKVVPVYNIAGVKVGDSSNKQLPKGVYVIGNKKVFVK